MPALLFASRQTVSVGWQHGPKSLRFSGPPADLDTQRLAGEFRKIYPNGKWGSLRSCRPASQPAALHAPCRTRARPVDDIINDQSDSSSESNSSFMASRGVYDSDCQSTPPIGLEKAPDHPETIRHPGTWKRITVLWLRSAGMPASVPRTALESLEPQALHTSLAAPQPDHSEIQSIPRVVESWPNAKRQALPKALRPWLHLA
ncbi:uncharacterized protein MYCFIDRAFT_179984 [Pseudocercospora fijiensis CIRAD86]|uniref:Uncharacterized protein n=1 Tax=Pseudocercospora fijiensis (strain CIRAD86) TaxID=383855 RepID=M2ZE62_PSEFD|nr:uncharacterized protein MYCFIDRAFT_179984 [Pseudocercospora fijiensis CIRAD86]EME77414.1 hypothetical protein MYCFIDRAFT_179984 [Pseudocercospora fijiensis CIRAD86]